MPLALRIGECQVLTVRRCNARRNAEWTCSHRLIVEALEEEETTSSGIVLPDTAKEKPQRGRVLAVGPGSRDEGGNYVAMDVVEGDEVIYSKYGGTEIRLGSDDYLILRESDILAKVVTTAKKGSKKKEMAGAAA